MTTPVAPWWLKEWKAPSVFNFTIPAGGESTPPWMPVYLHPFSDFQSGFVRAQASTTHWIASRFSITSLPWRRSFLKHHNGHMPHSIIPNLSSPTRSPLIRSAAQVTRHNFGSFMPSDSFRQYQNCLANMHSTRAWKVDSAAAPHTSQVANGSICLLCRFPRDGIYSFRTRHQNTRTCRLLVTSDWIQKVIFICRNKNQLYYKMKQTFG